MTKPSEDLQGYWIDSTVDYYFGSNIWSGKWFAFVDRDEVDALWEKTNIQVQKKKLGPAAKVSTARFNRSQKYTQLDNGRTHMIICYSYDYEDKEDRMRIANAMREECGLAGKALYYKRDYDTFDGVYGDACWYSILDPNQTEERLNEQRQAG